MQAAVDQAINSAPPMERTKRIISITQKKQSELEPQPRALAIKGAKVIAFLKEQVWVPRKRQKLQDPIELDKVKEAA